jgi:4'-phosphopantetheinyl transferase
MPQVYTVDLGRIDDVPPSWLALLDDEESLRADRFFHSRDRLIFVAAHALKRVVLAQAVPNCPAKSLRFLIDSFGKPSLADEVGIHFNLSHTSGLVALAVSYTAVGIDIEAMGSAALGRDVLQSILTISEGAALERVADWERAFLALWTAKEAVIKAEGKGLSLPLYEIAIEENSALGPSRRWTLWRSHPTPDHVLALAWSGSDVAVDHHPFCADDLTAFAQVEAIRPREGGWFP